MAQLELKTLKALQNDLKHNINELNSVIALETSIMSRSEEALKILRDKQSVYHDSLSSKFGGLESYGLFIPKRLAYESLKSSGLEIIKNDSLLSEITTLYDEVYASNEMLSDTKKELFSNSFQMIIKHFETQEKTLSRKPTDFEALKNDQEFINFLTYSMELKKFILENWYKRSARPQTMALKEKIDDEIRRLEK